MSIPQQASRSASGRTELGDCYGLTFIGIDVSKAHLDVFVRPTADSFSVAHTQADVEALVARVLTLAPQLVVLEATGGYEAVAARVFAPAGLPVAVVNPRQVRQFARATGKLAKTDPLDARLLAHVAEAIRPVPRALPDTKTEPLSQLLARRRQLVEMLVAERSRQRTATGLAREDVEVVITFLETRLAKLDQQLTQEVETEPAWQGKAQVLRSVPGIGPGLIHTLLSE